MRQNRDLARSNSVQAIKIRQLELEICRLRSENVSLSERAINLETELQDIKDHRPRHGRGGPDVENFKRTMECKLGELMSMLSELSRDPATEDGTSRYRRRSQIPPGSVERLSPNSRRQRRLSQKRVAALEAPNEEDESRLPDISEDKAYQRQTLEQDEMRRLIAEANNSDSPDLGPPPTTFFDREAPKEEERRPPTRDGSAMQRGWDENPQLMTALLSGNFETRRRRKSSVLTEKSGPTGLVFDASDASGTQSESTDAAETESLLKIGAKRKWDATRTSKASSRRQSATSEELALPSTSSKNDAPSHNRSATIEGSDELAHAERARVQVRQPARRALVPKAVNNDPVVSPRKPSLAADQDKPAKPDKPPVRPAGRLTSRNRGISIEPPTEPPLPVVKSAELNLEGKEQPQDLGDDIFSPPAEAASRPETPPPASAAGIEGPNGIRGSRRARPQVSYAEPSLIAKMRRPGKEMVDAVAKDGRRSSAANLVEPPHKSTEPPSRRSVSLKRPHPEHPAGDEDKPEPASPSVPRPRERPTQPAPADAPVAAVKDEPLDEPDVFDFASSSPASSAKPAAPAAHDRSRERRPSLGDPARLASAASRRRTLDAHGDGGTTTASTRPGSRPGSAAEVRGSDSEREAGRRLASRRTEAAAEKTLGRRRSMMV